MARQESAGREKSFLGKGSNARRAFGEWGKTKEEREREWKRKRERRENGRSSVTEKIRKQIT